MHTDHSLAETVGFDLVADWALVGTKAMWACPIWHRLSPARAMRAGTAACLKYLSPTVGLALEARSEWLPKVGKGKPLDFRAANLLTVSSNLISPFVSGWGEVCM